MASHKRLSNLTNPTSLLSVAFMLKINQHEKWLTIRRSPFLDFEWNSMPTLEKLKSFTTKGTSTTEYAHLLEEVLLPLRLGPIEQDQTVQELFQLEREIESGSQHALTVKDLRVAVATLPIGGVRMTPFGLEHLERLIHTFTTFLSEPKSKSAGPRPLGPIAFLHLVQLLLTQGGVVFIDRREAGASGMGLHQLNGTFSQIRRQMDEHA